MTDSLSAVREGYDRWSPIYDQEENPLIALEGPIIREWMGEVHQKKVLDLGCGTGRHSHWLSEAGAAVTAVDFSHGMLAKARQKPGAEKIAFLNHDLHFPLPFKDRDFDKVVSSLVLEHIRDLDYFMNQISRILKSGGQAVVSAMHPAMFLRGTHARFTDPKTGELVQPGNIPHSLGEMVMSVIRAGLTLDNIVEVCPDSEFAIKSPRAAKYLDWPMLVVFSLKR